MERENVLSLPTVQTLFNKFFRRGHKFFRDQMAGWIVHPEARPRIFGINRHNFNALAPMNRGEAIENAQEQMEGRYRDLFQRPTTAFTIATVLKLPLRRSLLVGQSSRSFKTLNS